MSTSDDYTPARLRELADNAFDTEFRDLQAALRAAAHELELAEETAREGAKERLEADAHYRATLAAREALLKKAGKQAREFADFHDWWTEDQYDNDRGWLPECAEEARALAAEIAAALGGKTDE